MLLGAAAASASEDAHVGLVIEAHEPALGFGIQRAVGPAQRAGDKNNSVPLARHARLHEERLVQRDAAPEFRVHAHGQRRPPGRPAGRAERLIENRHDHPAVHQSRRAFRARTEPHDGDERAVLRSLVIVQREKALRVRRRPGERATGGGEREGRDALPIKFGPGLHWSHVKNVIDVGVWKLFTLFTVITVVDDSCAKFWR